MAFFQQQVAVVRYSALPWLGQPWLGQPWLGSILVESLLCAPLGPGCSFLYLGVLAF